MDRRRGNIPFFTGIGISSVTGISSPAFYDQRFTLSLREQEVVRRPARLGLSQHCGLTPSIAAPASPF
jgi:hypothetical protein